MNPPNQSNVPLLERPLAKEAVWRERSGKLVTEERWEWRTPNGRTIARADASGNLLNDRKDFTPEKYTLTHFKPLCQHPENRLLPGMDGNLCPVCHLWYIDEGAIAEYYAAKRDGIGSWSDTIDDESAAKSATSTGENLTPSLLTLVRNAPPLENQQPVAEVLQPASDRTGQVIVSSIAADGAEILNQPGVFYIARAWHKGDVSLEDSIARNPYVMDYYENGVLVKRDGDRETVIRLYKQNILGPAILSSRNGKVKGIDLAELREFLVQLRDTLLQGEDVRLICHCKKAKAKKQPACHGDELKNGLNWMVQSELQRLGLVPSPQLQQSA